MHVLVVDGANVVGSRPDGWWRDRAGAAARLHEALTRLQSYDGSYDDSYDGPYDEVVLVLEGRARPGVPEGRADRVRTVHAPGEGDDTIVEVAAQAVQRGDEVTVVTADRGLRARVVEAGAGTTGPRTVLGP